MGDCQIGTKTDVTIVLAADGYVGILTISINPCPWVPEWHMDLSVWLSACLCEDIVLFTQLEYKLIIHIVLLVIHLNQAEA